MGWQVITSSVLESAAEQSEMKVVLRCENDVCVGALSVNFTKLYFVRVLHFTVGVTRLLLASRLSLLVINNGEKRDSLPLIGRYRKYHL